MTDARRPTDASASDRRLTDQGIERKQQLLDAATVLFAERGYAPTRIADICAAAGVAKGLFYWYFDSKQALFADLVRAMRFQLRRAQGQAMDASADALTQLRQGTAASVRFMDQHRAYFALLDIERSDPALVDVLVEGSDVYLADIERLVRQAQAAGHVADDDPRVLAVGVLGAVSSFSRAHRDGRLQLDPDELASVAADWVVRALSAPSHAAR